jgi:hypothetical protein
MGQPIGNWTDSACFYVSVYDQEKHRSSLIAGPFRAHESALAAKPEATRVAVELDPWGAFYAYGTVRCATGHTSGSLNSRLESAHPEINCGTWN